jgi:hypothetical protein
MSALLERLAGIYKATKFVKIVADMCIPNYPDRNVPTLLIYGQGDLKQQIVGLSRFGGKSANVENLEIVLKAIGALPKDFSNDETYQDDIGQNIVSEEDDDDWE